MPPLTHSDGAAVRRDLPKVMSLLTRLFRRVVKEAHGTVSAASRWMGMPERTLRRRIAKKDIPFAIVLATPQLGERFRRALCTEEHKEHAPEPYIARKRARK